MNGFTTFDAAIMLAYLAGIVSLGSLFYKGQKDVGDFFLGGRSFKWFPIALSVIATDLSAISYMGAPAHAFQYDLRYALVIFFLPVSAIFGVLVIIQVLYKLGVYTVYEYLETRFGVCLRILGSTLFVFLRLGWLATAIYTPSLALSVITGMNLTACILATGLFATFYATLGGMKAVIWCDVVQFFVLVGGAVLVLGFILWDFGGDIGGIWKIASDQGRTRLASFESDLTAEYTVWSLVAFSLVVNLSSYGVDQVVVQRYFSAKSFRDVLKSAVGQSLLVVPVTLLLFLVGIGLVAFYATNPAMMESLKAIAPENQKEAFDRVLPHFITYGMPAGITGLIIAAIMAATMSSVDSGVNSLATVATMDYYRRFLHAPEKTERHYLSAGRFFTAVIGALATTVALFVGKLGTIIEIIGKINGSLTGPLLALFLLALLTRRANSVGAFAGALIGLGAVLLIGQSDIFWGWYAPLGLATSLVSGYALSLAWAFLVPKRSSNH